jgi:hypothetical protein
MTSSEAVGTVPALQFAAVFQVFPEALLQVAVPAWAGCPKTATAKSNEDSEAFAILREPVRRAAWGVVFIDEDFLVFSNGLETAGGSTTRLQFCHTDESIYALLYITMQVLFNLF